MSSRRHHGPNVEDPWARQRGLRDLEMDELRRQLQKVQQCLARYEDGEGIDDDSSKSLDDENPFHNDGHEESSNESSHYSHV